MPASIGVNLRVTGHCRQGGRKYMEDFFSVAYQQTEDERDLEYAFFGIYDGHGGAEAAAFAKEHLMETIIKHRSFWSDNDEDVLRAIKDGYIATHYAMWREQEKWPKTASGLPSTAGTTASVAFIRRGKIYIGHVGDSGIILGYQEEGSSEWKARPLTRDHKPENFDEMVRINQCGGKVVTKSGVPRVVWNRPKMGHQGPVRRSTPIDEIPFLAVARSLGDLWSYNSQINQFIVSPDPDCSVMEIDTNTHRCLIFGTDGLFNMLSPQSTVHIVEQAERHNENAALSDNVNKTWLNPSRLLVEKALERWHNTKMRADNTSVVTLMLDPPGPPRAEVLKNLREKKTAPYPDSGLEIMTRFQHNPQSEGATLENEEEQESHENSENNNNDVMTPAKPPTPPPLPPLTSSEITSNFPLKERNCLSKPRESTSVDTKLQADDGKENLKAVDNVNNNNNSNQSDDSIQINEVSSSSNDESRVETLSHNTNKHNLRSTKKACNNNNNNNNVTNNNNNNTKIMTRAKRKLDEEDDRYDLRKKTKTDTIKTNKKIMITKKIGSAQKILKAKKLSLKKKNLQKVIEKKKILAVISKVKNNGKIKKGFNVVADYGVQRRSSSRRTSPRKNIKTKAMPKRKLQTKRLQQRK